MERRQFLRAAAFGVGSAALGFTLTRDAIGYPTRPGRSPYGALLPADRNGLMLPEGFTSRIIARSGRAVAGTSYRWHAAPDGGACFADGAGWIYVSNAELDDGAGGVSAVRFAANGEITAVYRILDGTNRNCAGGPTPWDTWLSCEEVDRGHVYETFPRGGRKAVRRPAMGRFTHEAAAVDPDRRVVYLTEDESDGCFYRFRPDRWPDLASGTLQVLAVRGGGVAWEDVPDPAARSTRTRYQVAAAKPFHGGEGAYYRAGLCYFTTKGDNRIWAYDAARNTLAALYDDAPPDAPLGGVDNITGGPSGDLFVAEDGDNMEICVITPQGLVAPFLRAVGHRGSEITGPAFNPAGDRLYFSSQRGAANLSEDGVTYEVTGPFRSAA